MAGLQELIPGLREAEAKDRDEQLTAFLGVEPDICGLVEVRPFTPQMFVELDGCENAFLRTGKRIQIEDICQLLWRVSPKFSRTDQELQKLFHAGLAVGLTYDDALPAILDYVNRAWAGMPDWPGSGKASAGVWPARLVHMFAKEYGWLEEYTLNLPYRRLWQYCNRIIEDHDRDYRQHCRAAMKLRSDFLTKMNAELAAAAAEAASRN